MPRPSPARHWCFTLNNWQQAELKEIVDQCLAKGYRYVIGKEVGESGTPHLQGYVELKKKSRFNTIFNGPWISRIHWEKSRNPQASRAYCKKDGDFLTNYPRKAIELVREEYERVVWRPWQDHLISLLGKRPDQRKILWHWDLTGNVGKSFLAKYLVVFHDAILATGKGADICHQVMKWMEEHEGQGPSLVVVDVPRTHTDFVNYSAIEGLKNGLIYSGKYEGGMCVFPIPHVVVFANVEPNYDAWSHDRYEVFSL